MGSFGSTYLHIMTLNFLLICRYIKAKKRSVGSISPLYFGCLQPCMRALLYTALTHCFSLPVMHHRLSSLLAAFLALTTVTTSPALNITPSTVVVDLTYTLQQGYLGVCFAFVLANR